MEVIRNLFQIIADWRQQKRRKALRGGRWLVVGTYQLRDVLGRVRHVTRVTWRKVEKHSRVKKRRECERRQRQMYHINSRFDGTKFVYGPRMHSEQLVLPSDMAKWSVPYNVYSFSVDRT